MSALKPCPFCGSEKSRCCDTGVFWVSCDGCGTEGPTSLNSKAEAIEAWNRRPEPSAPSPAGVEVVAWQWRKKPWAGSADGSAKWSDWQNGRAADAAKFEPSDYEERALVPAASLTSLQSENHALREEVERLTTQALAVTMQRDYAIKSDAVNFGRVIAAEARCSALEQALEDEREACAKIAETLPFAAEHHPTRIAKAIRARALQSKKT